MHNLESSPSTAEDSSDSSNVSRLSFFRRILEDDIAHFEDFEGEGVFTVLSEGLEESWEEGGSDDLVFYRFWVGENDGGRSIVGSVEEGKVLIVRALQIVAAHQQSESHRRRGKDERESEGGLRSIPLRSTVVASYR